MLCIEAWFSTVSALVGHVGHGAVSPWARHGAASPCECRCSSYRFVVALLFSPRGGALSDSIASLLVSGGSEATLLRSLATTLEELAGRVRGAADTA